mmetsp:Transcript_17477/g.56583  ORF Transcript_17477/g.56583 Transcript_17477/m.56583 type:complete len:97 (-) Transcript_17477:477-767(-)
MHRSSSRAAKLIRAGNVAASCAVVPNEDRPLRRPLRDEAARGVASRATGDERQAGEDVPRTKPSAALSCTSRGVQLSAAGGQGERQLRCTGDSCAS